MMKSAKPATDEMKQFQDDLLASVKEMKSGRAARTTQVIVTAASEARARTGLTQGEFAELLGVSVRTLQDWEQGRRDPTGAAQTLLRVAVKHPRILRGLATA
jgi:putative transcriptional regulator